MKKILFIIVVVATTLCFSSCSTLKNSATYSKTSINPVTAVMADVEVSPKKITHTYIPSKNVLKGGLKNVISSAVKEALEVHGSGDVLVALETQIKYKSLNKIESVTVSGYPAKYTNFKNVNDPAIVNQIISTNTESSKKGLIKSISY